MTLCICSSWRVSLDVLLGARIRRGTLAAARTAHLSAPLSITITAVCLYPSRQVRTRVAHAAGPPRAAGKLAGVMASTSEPQVDLGALDFWGQPGRGARPLLPWLRDERPLSRHEPPEDILGMPEQARSDILGARPLRGRASVSRDPKTFCSGEGTQFGDAPPEFLEAAMSFLAMDAPRHTKLRGLVSSAFTPRQVARIEDGIRANAKRIVEEAAPSGGGDFVELIAKRLPLVTISDMIGVPESDRERVVGGRGPAGHDLRPGGVRRAAPGRSARRGAVDADRVRQGTRRAPRAEPGRRT